MNKQVTKKLAYSFNEAAGLLSVCSKTLRNLASENEIKTIRIGRRRLIPQSEMLKLVNVHTHDETGRIGSTD